MLKSEQHVYKRYIQQARRADHISDDNRDKCQDRELICAGQSSAINTVDYFLRRLFFFVAVVGHSVGFWCENISFSATKIMIASLEEYFDNCFEWLWTVL